MLRITIIIFILVYRTGIWKTFFSRPVHIPFSWVQFFPFLSCLLACLFLAEKISILSLSHVLVVVWLSCLEEIIFRSLYFVGISRSIKNCLYSGLLYGLYYYTFYPRVGTMVIFSCVGFLYALSSAYFSLVELCFFRVMFNICTIA